MHPGLHILEKNAKTNSKHHLDCIISVQRHLFANSLLFEDVRPLKIG